MKTILFSLFFTLNLVSLAQETDTAFIEFSGNRYYHITNDSNSKVLLYLHGGINNPAFDDTSKIQELNFLLEGNEIFTSSALKEGFDILIPITNDSLNWLINPEYCFQNFTMYLNSKKSYSSHYISGFSDGGTGGYKIFYSHSDFFQGLIVFNGYPQHKYFNQNVDYAQIKNKEIIFLSTFSDAVIPYEFLLTEYSQQKKTNSNTFIYIKQGGHSFREYRQKEMDTCFQILASQIRNTQNVTTHGLILNDTLIEFYPFRKKIYKKYGYGKAFYKINLAQKKHLRSK